MDLSLHLGKLILLICHLAVLVPQGHLKLVLLFTEGGHLRNTAVDLLAHCHFSALLLRPLNFVHSVEDVVERNEGYTFVDLVHCLPDLFFCGSLRFTTFRLRACILPACLLQQYSFG
jgi:hypothetical protein